MRYFILFKDSLQEALDRKSFYVLIALSGLCILFCASISFRPLDERGALQAVADGFNVVSRTSMTQGRWDRTYAVKFEVGEVAAVEEEGTTRHRFRLTASPAEDLHKLVRHGVAVLDNRVKKASDPVPDADLPADFPLQKKYLRGRFREALIPNVDVTPAGEAAWDVAIRVAGRRALAGAEELSIVFGMFRFRPRATDPNTFNERYMSSAEFVSAVESNMADTLAGWVGMIVALVVTAGSVPNMLQKGTVDVLLSKPIHRTTLLVYKFLGGCTYVFLTGAFLIGGCWLALSVRTGHWNFYFPLTLLNLTFFFAVLYSVSVLMGVLTRSFGTACFVTLAVWAVCSVVGYAYMIAPVFNAPPTLLSTIRFVYLLLPKTSALSRLNAEICAKGNLGEAAPLSMPSFLPPLETELVLLTSAAFAVLMVALACVRFSKRDY